MILVPLAFALSPAIVFQDLDALDARIAAIGPALPVDRRLKLPNCGSLPEITQAGASALAVRCADAGWRILVPLIASAGPARADADIRKGDVVDLSIAGPGFSVSTSATALEDGRKGQALRLKAEATAPSITASVLGAGRARLDIEN